MGRKQHSLNFQRKVSGDSSLCSYACTSLPLLHTDAADHLCYTSCTLVNKLGICVRSHGETQLIFHFNLGYSVFVFQLRTYLELKQKFILEYVTDNRLLYFVFTYSLAFSISIHAMKMLVMFSEKNTVKSGRWQKF